MTRVARCVFLLAPAIGLPLISSHAQSATASSQPVAGQHAPPVNVATLHTGTKLVIADVIVRDKAGHPIHGLTRDDFVISESGKPQTVKSFEEYSKASFPVTAPDLPRLPAGMFTDFTPVASKGPLNVLLIDGLNTEIIDQAYFRQQLLEYLTQVPPGTRIAIFGMADHIYLLQGFTSDPRALRAALTSMKGSPHSTLGDGAATDQAALLGSLTDPSGGPADDHGTAVSLSSGGSALMSSSLDTFVEHITLSLAASRIQLTIEEMSQLAHWLLNFPGRKNVIWASSSFPLGVYPTASIQANTDIPSQQSDIYVRMVNLFAEAQISVYPLDPRGVQTDPGFNAEPVTPLNQMTAATARSATFYATKNAEYATMQAIASDTGGIPFYNRNNLTKAVGDAIENGSNYYTISYSPGEKKTGGEWRSIRVELANPTAYKGAQLSYRKGYFADNLKVTAHHTGTAEVTEDPNAPSVESSRYYRSAMLHGAPTQQDIPFTTRILPASTSTEDTIAAGNSLDAKDPIRPPYRRYDVDSAAAARYFSLIERPDGHHVGAVQIAVFVYDSRGKLLNTISRTLHFDLTPEEYAQFQRLGFREHLEISAPAKGESFFRIGVEEKTSGRIGTVEVASSAVNNLPPPEYAAAPGREASGATPQATGKQ